MNGHLDDCFHEVRCGGGGMDHGRHNRNPKQLCDGRPLGFLRLGIERISQDELHFGFAARQVQYFRLIGTHQQVDDLGGLRLAIGSLLDFLTRREDLDVLENGAALGSSARLLLVGSCAGHQHIDSHTGQYKSSQTDDLVHAQGDRAHAHRDGSRETGTGAFRGQSVHEDGLPLVDCGDNAATGGVSQRLDRIFGDRATPRRLFHVRVSHQCPDLQVVLGDDELVGSHGVPLRLYTHQDQAVQQVAGSTSYHQSEK